MKIQQKHLFHGAALTQIVEDPRFTALNKADEKYGHYQINHNKRLLVKYTANNRSPWSFTLQSDDIDTIMNDIYSEQESFLCLVCGKKTICILTAEEFENLVDANSENAQWIKVESPPNSGMRVSGSEGNILSVIAHNTFPKKLFENKA
jgi:hypothetical protein